MKNFIISSIVFWGLIISSCQKGKKDNDQNAGKTSQDSTDSTASIEVDSENIEDGPCRKCREVPAPFLISALGWIRYHSVSPVCHVISFKEKKFQYWCNPLHNIEIKVKDQNAEIEKHGQYDNGGVINKVVWENNSLELIFAHIDYTFPETSSGRLVLVPFREYHWVELVSDTLRHFIYKETVSPSKTLPTKEWKAKSLVFEMPLKIPSVLLINYKDFYCECGPEETVVEGVTYWPPN